MAEQTLDATLEATLDEMSDGQAHYALLHLFGGLAHLGAAETISGSRLADIFDRALEYGLQHDRPLKP